MIPSLTRSSLVPPTARFAGLLVVDWSCLLCLLFLLSDCFPDPLLVHHRCCQYLPLVPCLVCTTLRIREKFPHFPLPPPSAPLTTSAFWVNMLDITMMDEQQEQEFWTAPLGRMAWQPATRSMNSRFEQRISKCSNTLLFSG